MLSVMEGYYERLQALHTEIEQAMEGLPQEALDWAPGADMNSIAVMVAHVAGAERFWIGEVVGRDPADRDRPAEFRTRKLDQTALKQRLGEALAHTRGVLEALSWQGLEEKRVSPRNEREITVAWALLHALEHAALHLGHIQLTRQLWEQRS